MLTITVILVYSNDRHLGNNDIGFRLCFCNDEELVNLKAWDVLRIIHVDA